MNYEAAFLQAILADPDDNAFRLIYADWLEERGDPRGEFIRVQCAIPRIGKAIDFCECNRGRRRDQCDGCTANYGKLNAHRRRERELLECNWHPWSGIPSATYCANFHEAGAFGVQFRRGFVEAVECTATAWLNHADALIAAAPIREVLFTTQMDWYSQDGAAVLHDGRHPQIGPTSRRCKTAKLSGFPIGHLNLNIVREFLAAEWPRIKFTLLRQLDAFQGATDVSWDGVSFGTAEEVRVE